MLLVQVTGGGGLVNWLPYLLLFVQMTGDGGIREGRGKCRTEVCIMKWGGVVGSVYWTEASACLTGYYAESRVTHFIYKNMYEIEWKQCYRVFFKKDIFVYFGKSEGISHLGFL